MWKLELFACIAGRVRALRKWFFGRCIWPLGAVAWGVAYTGAIVPLELHVAPRCLQQQRKVKAFGWVLVEG